MRALPATGVVLLFACTKPTPSATTTAPAPAPAEPPAVAVVEPPAPAPVTATPAPEAAAAPVFTRPAAWPAAALFPEAFNPEHATLTVGDHGDLYLRHSVQGATNAAVAAGWTDTLTAGGFTPREPCTQAPEYSCVWIGQGRVVVVSTSPIWSGQGVQAVVHWLPAGHTPVARLPGPCVKPPRRVRNIEVRSSGIDQDGESHEASTRWTVDSDVGPDLDGDAVPELYVPHAKAGRCPWDIPHDVYVMRGECGHLVGTIVGMVDEPTHVSAFKNGLRVVHTSASWADHAGQGPEPVHHTRTRAYTFDGRRLQQTDATAGDGVCHHCGVARCIEAR